MSVVSGPPRAVYATAVETLAGSVVRALTGAGGAFQLADQLPSGGSPAECRAALAAVRVLGPDVLTPFVLAGHQFGAADAEVIATSIRTFPPPELGLDEGPDDTVLVRALREWATGEVLTQLGLPDFSRCYPESRGTGRGGDRVWVVWAGMLAQLSPLAMPGLDSPVHTEARRYRLDVSRGVTRSMLRRDHLTAARLTRWLALVGEVPMDPPFLVEPVLRQLELVAEADARLKLELTIARHALGGGASE
jgi:hypothetical protein